MTLNLKSYIGAFRTWAGKDAARHEVSLVSVWHPTLIVGRGHLASIRIDVARALVALAEEAGSDKVLRQLSDAIRASEAERTRIAAAGTGRTRATASGTASESPFMPGTDPDTRKAADDATYNDRLIARARKPAKPRPVTLSAAKGGADVVAE